MYCTVYLAFEQIYLAQKPDMPVLYVVYRCIRSSRHRLGFYAEITIFSDGVQNSGHIQKFESEACLTLNDKLFFYTQKLVQTKKLCLTTFLEPIISSVAL